MEEYKGYMIKPVENLIGYQVEYIGRGSAHMSLRGYFTDKGIARKFIDKYLERKEEEDGEKLQRSGSKQIQRRTYNRRKPANNS
jgi:hypothetical protein